MEPKITPIQQDHRVLHTSLLTLLVFTVFALGVSIGYFLPKRNSGEAPVVLEKNTKTKVSGINDTALENKTVPTDTLAAKIIYKINALDINLELPAGWSATMNEDKKVGCTDAKEYLKTPTNCKGSINSLQVVLKNTDGATIILTAPGTNPTVTCEQGACGKPVASKVTVLGAVYDLKMVYTQDGGEYSTFPTNPIISTTGKNSLWKKFMVNVVADNEKDFKEVLDIFNSMKQV